MRSVSSAIPAALAVAALAGLGFAATPAPRYVDLPGAKQAGSVDVELVLAVDISYSMDPDEHALQREGYVEALTSSEFLNTLRHGMHGRIAVTYVEWAGVIDQKIIMPWRLIDGRATAEKVAAEISRAPYRRAYRTSIAGALSFSAPLFEENGYRIMLKRPNPATMDIPDLDIYYEDCVIGGPGAFVVPIQEREKFREAIRTKLVLEIAGRTPEPRLLPAAADAPRISCTIGERMWQQRWGGGIDLR